MTNDHIPGAYEAEKAHGAHYDACQHCRSSDMPCAEGLKLRDEALAPYDAHAIARLDEATCRKELDMLPPDAETSSYPPGVERCRRLLLERIRELAGAQVSR